MDTFSSRRYTGYAYLKKTSGGGPVPSGTDILIPYHTCDLECPDDVAAPGAAPGANPSRRVATGRLTPTVRIVTAARGNWFGPSLLNSLIVSRDKSMDADSWAVRKVAPQSGPEVFAGVQFGTLSIAHRTAGGPMPVELGGLAADPTGRYSFPATGTVERFEEGYTSTIQHDGVGSEGLVRSWHLLLQCPQRYEYLSREGLTPSFVSTGGIGGILEVEGPASSVTIPGDTVTITIDDARGHQNVAVTVRLDANRKWRPRNSGLGNLVAVYTLGLGPDGEPPVTFE